MTPMGSYLPRPPTPPYVRFRIRRFVLRFGVSCDSPGSASCSLAVSLVAPFGPFAYSVRYLTNRRRVPTVLLLLFDSSKAYSPCLFARSGLQCVSAPTMPSADSCRLFSHSLEFGSCCFQQADRPPRVLRVFFPAYACRIYAHDFRIGFGL